MLPSMKKNKFGRIVNISSAHGLVASKGKAAYVAAKHGVVGLTKVVALENAREGITCNAICPGWVLTPLVQKQIDDLKAKENNSQSQNNKNTKSKTSKSAKVSSNIEQTLISQLEKMFSLAFAKKRKEQKQDREREPKNQKRTLERDNKENLSAQKRAELEGKNREVSMDDPDVLEGLLTDDPDKETSKTRGKDKRRIGAVS